MIKRREFITGLGGVVAWPLASRAQQRSLPVIGYLSSRSAQAEIPILSEFRQGLAAVDIVEGRNVEIEFRFADGEIDRLPALATELVRRQPVAIVAVTTVASVAAAKAADGKIPVVFNVGGDPTQLGLAVSFNRPGGNMTGIYNVTDDLTSKMLSLLHDLVPKATTIGLLQWTRNSKLLLDSQLTGAREAAAKLGMRLLAISVGTDREVEAAFDWLVEQRAEALLIPTQPYFITRAEKIVDLAARHSLPAMYNRRIYAVAGGLISYGDNITETYRATGVYAGRVLKGEKPADLPVLQTTKLELIINLKTAKALGLTIPETLLATADEVIQ